MRNRQRYPREPKDRLRFLPREIGNNPSYRGGNWARQRGLALERSRGRCEGCGRLPGQNGAKLAVHHTRGWSYGGTNDLVNLRVLCELCHPAYEIYRNRDRAKVEA